MDYKLARVPFLVSADPWNDGLEASSSGTQRMNDNPIRTVSAILIRNLTDFFQRERAVGDVLVADVSGRVISSTQVERRHFGPTPQPADLFHTFLVRRCGSCGRNTHRQLPDRVGRDISFFFADFLKLIRRRRK
jgi:hypothetical protein